tara:strand:+ start:372 stop:671 length:300 start_codon:yes stop_codon:yes gene_type:complete
MDTVKDYVMASWDKLYNFINPYKHITIESVNDDADIENQYEKISKKVVVGLGNILVNLLILKIDFTKKIVNDFIEKYNEYMKESVTTEDYVDINKEKEE